MKAARGSSTTMNEREGDRSAGSGNVKPDPIKTAEAGEMARAFR